jgi:hypothetical protein
MLTHKKKMCNPFWGSAISRKSIDIYRYALTGWGEEWGTIGVIWPYVNGIVYAILLLHGELYLPFAQESSTRIAEESILTGDSLWISLNASICHLPKSLRPIILPQKLCHTYLLRGYEAPSLTQSLQRLPPYCLIGLRCRLPPDSPVRTLSSLSNAAPICLLYHNSSARNGSLYSTWKQDR